MEEAHFFSLCPWVHMCGLHFKTPRKVQELFHYKIIGQWRRMYGFKANHKAANPIMHLLIWLFGCGFFCELSIAKTYCFSLTKEKNYIEGPLPFIFNKNFPEAYYMSLLGLQLNEMKIISHPNNLVILLPCLGRLMLNYAAGINM